MSNFPSQLAGQPGEPPFATIPEALRRAAAQWPDQEAMVADGERIRYGTLLERVQRAAANLHRLGLRRGDHMAICMGNCVDWVVVAYAAGWIGAVVVPVNTRFKAEEMRYCLAQSDARLLVVADRFLGIDFISMLRAIAPAIERRLPDPALPKLHTVVVFGDDVPASALPAAELARDIVPGSAGGAEPGPEDVALIQYTSGTTAYPKGVMLSHRSMMLDAWHFGRRLGLRQGDRYFSGRPLFHVAGTTLSMLASMAAGACYITAPSFDVARVLKDMEEERCTMTSANDTMFLMLMHHPDFRPERLALRGGMAAVSPEVARQIVERIGMREVCVGYGLSESSPNCALSPYDDDIERRIAGYAYPLPGLEVKIFVPDTNESLPAGTTGEICIRGWSLMKGYYNMPEATAKAIDAAGWLHTGDLGVADEQGRICFIDRLKDMIRVGGENVAPADVESVLSAHPGVKHAQVVGVPDPRLTEVAAAYVIRKEGEAPTPEELIAWCKERCAGFKVPRYVRFVDSFDAIGMTASAKIQRNKLREYALGDLGLVDPKRSPAPDPKPGSA
jgi:fatty-acyl-CoA synthase